MGLFSKEPPPPSTVSDGTWGKVRRAAAASVPYVETPDSDPAAIAKKRLWENAPKNAASN
jgi:hypothetical protein